jgi:glycosyltransferase involved in cell wall biosynthesis
VADAIVHLPFLERPELASVYRRASLVLLPSDREGFGLPVVEALACGTPVLASDIASLIEVGGDAVAHCDPADLACWVSTTLGLLAEREEQPEEWEQRRQRGLKTAARFSWRAYAAEMARIYQSVYTS